MFKSVNRVIFFLAFLLAANLYYCSNALAFNLSVEPVNPAFQEFLLSNPVVEGQKLGTIPSPIKVSGITEISEGSSNFDLRTVNRITPVKDQIVYGPDWAFAGLGSLESNFLTSSGVEADFSERHLMNNTLYDLDFSQGGNRNMATGYFTGYFGPVDENDDLPYNPPSTATNGSMPDKVRRHVQDIIFIPDKDFEAIQRHIKDYGAVVSTVYWSSANYNTPLSSYYYNGTQRANHSILIVGWDDNYSKSNFLTPPPGDGAFLVKDSWGTNSHNQGYYYISYYDSIIGTDNYGIAKTEQTDNYKQIYQYDRLGWTSSAGLGSNTAWFSNVFTPVNGALEQIEAVAFYTKTPNAAYELYVASDFYATGFGGMVLVKQGTIKEPGYHTIKLDLPVKLKNNRRFAAAIKLTTPGSNYPIALESPIAGYSSGALSNEAESFISDSGLASSWVDLKETNLSNSNVCLKVFTNEVPPLISFSPASYTVAENAGSVNLTVTRTQNTMGSLTVNYTTADGTATAGNDFVASNGTITFIDGETTKNISIPVLDDGVFEPTESFNVTLSNPSKGTIIGDSATVQISDNDAQIAFNPSSYTVDENAGIVTLTVTRTQSTDSTLTVEYATVRGSATENSDYIPTNGIITFAGGETTKTVSISILDDSLYEPNENLTVSLSNPSNGSITQAIATVNIIDDDLAPRITFDPINYTVAENDGSVTVIVYRSQNTANPLTVNYTTVNGTAAGGSDYATISGVIAFASGEVTKAVYIPILDDNFFESGETFTVNLSNVSVGEVISPNATVTITENDSAPQISINPVSYTVDENSEFVTLIVNRNYNTAGNLTFSYSTSNGTAVAGSDYTSSSGTLTFNDGETTKSISVPILNDSIYESNESFAVVISNPSNGTISNANATVTITDNDSLISFSPSTYNVEETAGIVALTVYRSANTTGSLTINYSASNGSAVAGSDYTTSTGTIYFLDGEAVKTISIPIINDSTYETTESFTVSLSNPSNGSIGIGTANVTITDDDTTPEIGFNPIDYSLLENEGTVTLTVYRSQNLSGSLSIDYSTVRGTADAVSDFISSSGRLTFAEGETTKVITISIVDDGIFEQNESFTVNLSNPSTIASINNSATIHITDNDPQIGFDPTDYVVNEEAGSVALVVKRINTIGSVDINYSTSPGSATADTDFSPANGTIHFNAGEAVKTFTIPILDDGLHENTESFSVNLTNHSNGTLINAAAIVKIMDNDSAPKAEFNPTTYSIRENEGMVNLYVYRTVNLNGSFTVNYATTNGTATAGSDYTSPGDTLVFTDGESYKIISIPIIDNKEFKPAKSFRVNLALPGEDLTVNNIADVTIIDDDPRIGFYSNTYTVSEGSGTVSLSVYRTENTDGPLTVEYITANGTALASGDYTTSSGVLTFANGESVKNIIVPILEDSISESSETFTVTITNVSTGTITVPTATVTINDNEGVPGIWFSAPMYFVGESDSKAIITVSRETNAGLTSSVKYSLEDLTATSPSDYAKITGIITFNPNETTKIVAVDVYDDSLVEGDETLIIKLSDPDSSSILYQDTAKIVILDNDDNNPGLVEDTGDISWTGDWTKVINNTSSGGSHKSSTGEVAEDSGNSIEWSGNWTTNTSSASGASGASFRYTNDSIEKAVEEVPIVWSGSWETETNGNTSGGSHKLGGIRKVDENDESITWTGSWSSLATTVTPFGGLYKTPVEVEWKTEEISSSLIWTGTWSSTTDSKYSAVTGAQVSYTFNNDSVTWYTQLSSSAGIASVYIDGQLVDQKDLYSSTTQKIGYTYKTTSGAHTIMIECSGTKNSLSSGTRIWLDAFGIRDDFVDDTDSKLSSIVWNGSWNTSNYNYDLGGWHHYTFYDGASASFTFYGEAVTLHSAKNDSYGKASISIDGVLNQTIDLYAPSSSPEYRAKAAFTIDGLTPGKHTITVGFTGTKNPSSKGDAIVVDGFSVPKVNYTSSIHFYGDSVIWYTFKSSKGGMAEVYMDDQLIETVDLFVSGSDLAVRKSYKASSIGEHTLTIKSLSKKNISSTGYLVPIDAFGFPSADQAASISFSGDNVSWVTSTGPDRGIAEVYIDGALVDTVDLYSPIEEFQVKKKYNVESGLHTITLKSTGNSNVNSSSTLIPVDGFIVPSKVSASYIFNGDKVIWYYGTGNNRGIAKVYIDGELVDTVDQYSAGTSFTSKIYQVASTGSAHNIEIIPTGTKNSSSTGNLVSVDAFISLRDTSASFNFTGTGVTWYSYKGKDRGIAKVYIDNNLVETVDLYSGANIPPQSIAKSYNVPYGSHVIRIEAVGKNNASTGTAIDVDAFKYTP